MSNGAVELFPQRAYDRLALCISQRPDELFSSCQDGRNRLVRGVFSTVTPDVETPSQRNRNGSL